ncbi:iron complex transport system substrate-binding protein [Paenibacillus turicensis]|uniref:Iron complex transport system substrate-binding protein n=1 Tax=Paenibacillus turicensis TaxID=160487 RepID=A0ABS4FVY2_9BACL|nr:ABC transporter substrate-binding protein [Paenibacillus turicensis]MBP1906740.1 iron complex transport system substrate-binding protein [Paenibacillus turicensis]
MAFRSKIITLAFVLLLSGLLTACGTTTQSQSSQADNSNKGSASANVTAIDHKAGTTKITGVPKRIAVMEYGLLATVLSLGETPIAYTDDGKQDTLQELGFLDKIKGYTSIGTRQQPNLELLRTAKPDLIIGDYARHKDIYNELSNIAPTLLLPDTKATYEDAIQNELIIGQALHKDTEARAYVEAHQAKLQEVVSKAPKDKSYLIAALGEKVINPRTNLFFQPNMLQSAGLNYALTAADKKETARKVDLEQMLEIDPDILFVTNEQFLEKWESDPLYKQLKAVQNNHVFVVSHSKWSFNRSLYGANVVLDEFEALLPKMK